MFKLQVIDNESVLSFYKLLSDKLFLLELNRSVNRNYYIEYNKETYKILFTKKESDNIFLFILIKITELDNSNNEPMIPKMMDSFLACPSCGYFDIDPIMDHCPRCNQKIIYNKEY